MAVDTDGSRPAEPGGLQGVPWFSACTEDQLRQVARIAERLHIQAGRGHPARGAPRS